MEPILKKLRPLRSKSVIFDKAYEVLAHFYADSLYRNSIYLMSSTFIMSILGFFFWMINARLYTPAEIGIATTLISTSALIVNIGLLGLNSSVIRYLPTWKDKNSFINLIFFCISGASLVVAVAFVILSAQFAPKLHPVFLDGVFMLFFIFFIGVSSLNTITDSLFISYRSAQFVLIIYTIMSISRILFAVVLPKTLHNAVFYAYAFSIIIAAVLSIIFLRKYLGYRFARNWKIKELGETWRYSFSNYVSSIVAGIPTLILPLFILNRIGSAQAAYHYIGMTIASAIFVIPQSITQSLFSEGSHNEKELKSLVKKTLLFSVSLLSVPVVLFILFGKYLLILFGKDYSANVYLYLCLLILSAYPLAVNYVCYSIVKIKKMNKELVGVNVINTIIFVILYFSLIRFGLMGVGVAWLTGNIIAAIIYVIAVFMAFRKSPTHA